MLPGLEIASVGRQKKIAFMHISSLIEELEDAIASGSVEKRLKSLWRVVDLFEDGAGRYSDEQVALFDDVIGKLAAEIETKARARLARRLAPVDNAPTKVIRSLAFDDDSSVAAPVLTCSNRLDDADLIATAQSKGQDHLYAITRRKSLSVAVTDVLVDRGDHHVMRSVARNQGARFSDAGFGKLVARARGDATLAIGVGGRPDIPRQHFLKLVETASATVRTRLANANPQLGAAVNDAINEVVGNLRSQLRNASPDHATARAQVARLKHLGRLGEADVYDFARERKFEQTAIALSLLCRVPVDVVERALLDDNADMVLILVKAAQCSWTTAKALLLMQAADRGIAAQDLDRALRSFQRLSSETAQRVLEFYRERGQVDDTDAAPPAAPNPRRMDMAAIGE
jgi:uncharacterized protein (DUF2336 family)